MSNNGEQGRSPGTAHSRVDEDDDEHDHEEDDKSLGTKWRKRLRGKGLLRLSMGGGLPADSITCSQHDIRE